MSKADVSNQIKQLEAAMAMPDFWNNKEEAQKIIQQYQDLKDAEAGVGKYDNHDSVITILAGAGGTDAEDFVRLLLEMYVKYCESKGWSTSLLHDHQNDQGGFRNVTILVTGKSFARLKFESGVHRLVRISPFNAQKKRHTAFAMVEVVPKLKQLSEIELDDKDLEIEFSKSSGPGGQNVNKRETAVKITHLPTGLNAHASSERTQEANRNQAMELLLGRLYKRLEEDRAEKEGDFRISKTTANEWGSQIRSYVLHPYQLVKDHRSNYEHRDPDAVFKGEIDELIESVAKL